MSDMLSIGSSGVSAYQRALATVSNNIANVNTDGYARQDIQIASNQPTEIGGGFIGTGVRFDQVRRQYDAFVESNLRNSNSDLKAQEPLLSYVNRLIDVMGNESIGLTSALNQFFASARDLSSDPASMVARTTFLRDSEGLAGRFRQLSSQIDTLKTETRQSIETDVGQVNALTAQLAQLNKQLSKKGSADEQPSELLDQRDLLLRNLSGLIAIKTKFSINGSVLISVGDTIDQGILVRNDVAKAISVGDSTTDRNKLTFTIDAYGSPEGMPGVSGGRIGGVLNFRDQVLQPADDALDDLARVMVKEVNAVHQTGIDAEGQLGGELLGFAAGQAGWAGAMVVRIQDAARIAAAGQFRVIDDPLNPGSAQSRINYQEPNHPGPTGLAGELAQGTAPHMGRDTLSIAASQGFVSLGLIKAGTRDLVLTLNDPSDTQQLQVFTRDGRHLLGTDLNGTDIGTRILKPANGFESGASYSNAVLNAGVRQVAGQSVDDRYLDMDLFIGAKASVQKIQQFDASEGTVIAPTLEPAVLQGLTPVDVSVLSKANAFTLNGVPLPPLLTSPASASDWVSQVNQISLSNQLGVTASLDPTGQYLILTRTDGSNGDIRLGFGPNGNPSDLKKLGFNTSAYISGISQDDLLAFVTDTKQPQAATVLSNVAVTAQFEGVDGDIKQMLRKQSLSVSFAKDPQSQLLYYTITDSKTNTVLAHRLFDTTVGGTPTIKYRGITLEFTTQPIDQDKFTIDGNQDGVGNNEAMLRLVDLEKAKVTPSGMTITEAYIERVNQVGSVARQASIAKEALTVVYQQAQQSRDGVSGVSLDQEASELVRYQQAYQANAKVMSVASNLFDAILQLR